MTAKRLLEAVLVLLVGQTTKAVRINKSCKNKQFTEVISFHKYPNKILYPERFERLVCFIRRHKIDF